MVKNTKEQGSSKKVFDIGSKVKATRKNFVYSFETDGGLGGRQIKRSKTEH